jgi:ABC-2 type transport system ATP-binding protein
MTATNEIIHLNDVVKDYRPGFGLRKKRVLHGISFRVQEGEIFGFVGPNGAGKTTTLKVLMGLVRATSGNASILGHDVSESSYRKEIGFLPENAYFYDYLTGRELLDFYAKLSGVPAALRHERTEKLLEWVDLSHAADQRIRSYSKGMAQRVGIAQALVHDPSVVFLDEPMSGLDPIGRKAIRDLILRLREEGKTVFMNTHILSDVEMVCDRVAIIVEGRIRYEGRMEEFLSSDDHECDVALSNVSPDAAATLEESYGLVLRGVGERVEISVNEKQVDEVLKLVLADGGNVLSVTRHRVSLESVFMDTVRKDEMQKREES